MKDAKSSCQNGIQKAEKDCEGALGAAEKWLKDAAKTVVNAVKSIWGKRRRRAIHVPDSNPSRTEGRSGSRGEPTPVMVHHNPLPTDIVLKERGNMSFTGFYFKNTEMDVKDQRGLNTFSRGSGRYL